MPTHSLELPLLSASQAQKHLTVNAALTRLDRLVQLAVRSRGLSSPPAAPAEGDAYIVGTTPSGDWLGHENAVAVFDGDAWDVHAPAPGWLAYVADEDAYCRFAGQWDAVAFVGGGT